MVKRKKEDEVLPVYGGQDQQSLPTMSAQEPGVKKTRTNPPRMVRMAPTAQTAASSEIASPKRARVTRKRKVAQASPEPGPSIPQAGSSQPTAPAKRGRKKKVTDDTQSGPEKRKAIFRPQCPQNILERVERVMTQRFFMIDRYREGGKLCEQFSILGSTGNVYTVTIDHLPRCNCPDSVRGNHCKHILFVFLKVLGVKRESGTWYQKGLLTDELEQMFRDAPLAPNVRAHDRIREAYARATGKVVEQSSDNDSKKRMPAEDDDCPICYDGMHGVPESTLVFCEECRNALHKECFAEWQKTSQSNRKELTCVYCRARWVIAGPSHAVPAKKAHGYVNLAAVAGVSPVRDTSTYYRGRNYHDD